LNEPKRHHYNPEMLSSRFADEDGNLHFFDKRVPKKGIMTAKPENVFVQGHLYSHINKDGSKNTALEKYFSYLEGRAAKLIARITTAARMGQVPGLTDSEKSEWDAYIYHQWSRVPDLHARTSKNFDSLLRNLVKDFERNIRPLTVAERADLEKPEAIARIHQNARVSSLRSNSGPAVKAMGNRGLAVAVIRNPKKSFVLGSLPVVKLTPPGRTHIADPAVEVWLPIAADIAVGLGKARGTEIPVPITDRQIRNLNEAIFRQSTVIAGRSPELIASLASQNLPTTHSVSVPLPRKRGRKFD
jgi:hypothetical protein